MQMILLGNPISANEAFSAGLVAEVFEDRTVLNKVLAIAAKLAQASPSALSLAKEAICRGEYSDGIPERCQRSILITG